VQSSIPVGLNDESLKREETVHKMEIRYDLLSSYFEEGAELSRVNMIYELFTTPDLMRKAELLLTQPLGEMALSKAWTDLMAEKQDLTLLAYTALQVETRRPGTGPQELLASLSAKITPGQLNTKCIARLEGDAVEHIEEVEQLLAQDTDLGKLVAYHRASELVDTANVNPRTIRATGDAIRNTGGGNRICLRDWATQSIPQDVTDTPVQQLCRSPNPGARNYETKPSAPRGLSFLILAGWESVPFPTRSLRGRRTGVA